MLNFLIASDIGTFFCLSNVTVSLPFLIAFNIAAKGLSICVLFNLFASLEIICMFSVYPGAFSKVADRPNTSSITLPFCPGIFLLCFPKSPLIKESLNLIL